MTRPNRPASRIPLVKGVRLRGERRRRWLREGEPSVARRLAQIGVLGWIIVMPMLIGIFVGRWLDQHVQLRPVLDRAAADARAGARLLVRLEMDEERMSLGSFDHLPPGRWPSASPRISSPGSGSASLYFSAVWWNARLFAAGGRRDRRPSP